MPNLQQRAREALRRGLIAYDQRHGFRGAEENLLQNRDAQASEAADIDVASGSTELRQRALQRLAQAPTPGGLAAAVVIAINDTQATALLADEREIPLTMDSMGWARPYVSVNERGPVPQKVTDVLTLGDLIRVQPNTVPADDAAAQDAAPAWLLSQVPEVQGALVSIHPRTGAVLALVGGYDFSVNQFNHALQAARQPGSSFKPFVYSAALANGVTPASIYMDAPLVFDDAGLETEYRPDNDNRRYNGPTRLREALYRSINLVSIRVMLDIGAEAIIDHVKPFGFNTGTFPRNTQLAIGGGTMEVTPLQSARAYAVFANGGYRIDPHVLQHLADRHGNVLRKNKPALVCAECRDDLEPQPPHCAADDPLRVAAATRVDGADTDNTAIDDTGGDTSVNTPGQADAAPFAQTEPEYTCANRVLDERNAFIMNSMLSDVVRRGTGNRAWKKFQRSDLGGKTGTTNDAADTWFSGFNQEVVTTVWVGFSNFDPLGARAYGGNTPLPIWIDYMEKAIEPVPETARVQPPGIAVVKIDPETGEAVPPGVRDAIFEYFYAETAPQPPSRRDGAPRRKDPDAFNPIDIF